MTTDEIKALIIQTAQSYGTNALQALAQAKAESNFSQVAISPAGAIGIFQLMPATAAQLGVDPYDPAQNIDGGVRYIKQVNNWFPGRLDLALAAYNWGIGNVNKMIWGSTNFPPASSWPDTAAVMSIVPLETRNYINRVIGYMTSLVNDPVYIASGSGGELPPNGQVEIGDSDIKLIAGITVAVLLLVALLRR